MSGAELIILDVCIILAILFIGGLLLNITHDFVEDNRLLKEYEKYCFAKAKECEENIEELRQIREECLKRAEELKGKTNE